MSESPPPHFAGLAGSTPPPDVRPAYRAPVTGSTRAATRLSTGSLSAAPHYAIDPALEHDLLVEGEDEGSEDEEDPTYGHSVARQEHAPAPTRRRGTASSKSSAPRRISRKVEKRIQSCTNCRKRKMKCSRTFPSCIGCQMRGEECKWPPNIKMPTLASTFPNNPSLGYTVTIDPNQEADESSLPEQMRQLRGLVELLVTRCEQVELAGGLGPLPPAMPLGMSMGMGMPGMGWPSPDTGAGGMYPGMGMPGSMQMGEQMGMGPWGMGSPGGWGIETPPMHYQPQHGGYPHPDEAYHHSSLQSPPTPPERDEEDEGPVASGSGSRQQQYAETEISEARKVELLLAIGRAADYDRERAKAGREGYAEMA